MDIRKLSLAFVLIFIFIGQVAGVENLGTSPESAQETNMLLYRPIRTNYSIGLWGGVNYSKTLFNGKFYVGNADIVKSQFRIGHSLGLSASLQKSDEWSFQADFIIEQRGMYYESKSQEIFYMPGSAPTTFTFDTKSNLILNYMSIPIVAKRHFGRVVKWYAEAGACFSNLITAKVKGEYRYDFTSPSGSILSQSSDIDIVSTGDYGHDVSVLGGLGLAIPIRSNFRGPIVSLVLNMRYYHGLLNVYKGEEPPPLDPLILIDPNAEIEEPVHPNDGQVVKNSVMNFRIGFVVAI